MYFTDAEWYEIDLQEFGQEQVDDWYGEDVEFADRSMELISLSLIHI